MEKAVTDAKQAFSAELQKLIREDWRNFASFLNHNINQAKKALGNQCTFLSFMNLKELNPDTGEWEYVKCFYAIMKNDLDTKDRVTFRLNKDIWDIDASDFKNLVFALNSRAYDTRGTV